MPGQDPILGEQLNIIDVANDIAVDSTAIGSIATGITTDPSSIAIFDADYLRRDGTTTMDGTLTISGVNNLVVGGDVTVTGTVDGRNVSADGIVLDSHVAIGSPPIHFTEASIDHNAIQNIGANSHTTIDSHLINGSVHFTQAAIIITESQISDLQSYLFNVVEDVTPQLGGNLDVGAFIITGTDSVTVAGTATIKGGDGLTNAQGANVSVLGGNGTAANFSGSVILEGGTSAGSGLGGNVILRSGGSSTGPDGFVSVESGDAVGQGEIRLVAKNLARYVGLKASSTLAADITYVLPAADGSNGDILTTDGLGIMSWATGVTNPMTANLDTGGFNIITANKSDGTNVNNISIVGGNETNIGSGNAGAVSIIGGAASQGQSGAITITGGSGYYGGAVTISAGTTSADPPAPTPDVNITAQTGYYSGNVVITAGYSATNPGGEIRLTHGGSGVDGNVNQGAVVVKNSVSTNASIVRMYTGANFVEVSSPALSGNVNFVLPNTNGTSGDVLTSNGTGATSWTSLSKINAQTVTEYTLQLSDINTMVTMSVTGSPNANTVNIPSSVITNFPIGSEIKVNQLGIGTTTIQMSIVGSPADTVYIVGGGTSATLVQHQTATLTKLSATEWNISLSKSTP